MAACVNCNNNGHRITSFLCSAPELSASGGRRDKEGRPTLHTRDKRKGDQDGAELIHDTTLASTEPQHTGPDFPWTYSRS